MSNYNSTLQTNNSSLEEIITQLNSLPDAPEAVTQATPAITINQTTGLITATATQIAGYVPAGTKSATHQLAFQPAKTITPGTTNQTAVAANTYVGGAVTVAGDTNLKAENIVNGKTIFGITGTATTGGGNDPFASMSPFTYTVDVVSGATYGFTLNSNGYYESQNKGKNSTYAICRVNLTVIDTSDIIFDVINYAESSFDYAIMGKIDSALTLSNSTDSNYHKSFKGLQSASIVPVTYNSVTPGSHFIDIKFVKDSSQHNNNDSVQFKIQGENVGLPQETINKILAADPDLIAGNIRAGVDIFGVVGTVAVGDTSVEDELITKTLTSYTNDRVTSIGDWVFYSYPYLTSVSFPQCLTIGSSAFFRCINLTTANFPLCKTIGSYAFAVCSELTTLSFPQCTTIRNNVFDDCINLTTANFPLCKTIGSYAFLRCTNLTTLSFPQCTTIASSAFMGCNNLTTVNFPQCLTIEYCAFSGCNNLTTANFPQCTTIASFAFSVCSKLTTIYLNASQLCALNHSNAFYRTQITSTTGSIFVPASLVASYKAATNWAYFSNRIFAYSA